MISQIVIAIFTKLAALLFAEVMKRQAKKQTEAIGEAEIDKRAADLKAVAAEVLDGQPMSKEQREKLIRSITDFVRSSPTSRGL